MRRASLSQGNLRLTQRAAGSALATGAGSGGGTLQFDLAPREALCGLGVRAFYTRLQGSLEQNADPGRIAAHHRRQNPLPSCADLTPRGRYRVKSKTVWRGEKSAKGYDLTDLKEPIARYLASQSVNPSEPQKSAGYSAIQSVREQSALTDSKPLKPAENGHSDGLTDRNGEAGADIGFEVADDPEERAAIQEFDGVLDTQEGT